MKTMEKIAMAIKNNKLAISASVAAQCVAAGAFPAFASETSTGSGVPDIGSQLSTALSEGISKGVLDLVGYMTAILPFGITVFTAFWGTRKALSFFRATAGGSATA